MRARTFIGIVFGFIAAIILLILAALAFFLPVSVSAQTRPSQSCFTETGYCIAGPIRDYWERNGGLPVFGYPISEQRVETVEGRTIQVQWFERDRLEIQRDGTITAGRLGARYLEVTGRDWRLYQPEAPINSAECRYFPQTQRNLCGSFWGHWESNGGLERFGYPITPVIDEVIEGRTYKVQYFERRRMEYHPQNYYPYDLLLGLLGREIYNRQGAQQPGDQVIDLERDQALISLYEFFDALARREYAAAGDLYGGDMTQLASWNPDIRGDAYGDRTVRTALIVRGCEQNGLACLGVSRTVAEQRVANQSYRFTVELARADGRVFRTSNGTTRFTFDVMYNGARYVVMQLPPYAN